MALILNPDDILREESEGFINRTQHPEYPLWIHNYTPSAQYSSRWNDVTRQCRGLILDEDFHVVARPFQKFFNLEEHSRSDIVFSKPFRLMQKLDGSLGILYSYEGNLHIATRGSFVSDQAQVGTDLIRNRYSHFEPLDDVTYLYEIIYPQNKIVVDYGSATNLYLLAVIDNETGEDLPVDQTGWPGPVAEEVDPQGYKPRDLKDTLGRTDGSEEGFVLIFNWPKQGPRTRVKVKHSEYVRIHRLVTGLSERAVWDMLRNGAELSTYIGDIPDEFYSWVEGVAAKLVGKYRQYTYASEFVFNEVMSSVSTSALDTSFLNEQLQDWYDITEEDIEDESDKYLEAFSAWRKKSFALGLNSFLDDPDTFIPNEAFGIDRKDLRPIAFFIYNDQMDEIQDYIWRKLKPEGNVRPTAFNSEEEV